MLINPTTLVLSLRPDIVLFAPQIGEQAVDSEKSIMRPLRAIHFAHLAFLVSKM